MLMAAFGVYLVALALVVFLPSKEASTVTGFVGVIAEWLAALGLPFEEAAVGVEFVSNIVMFVPFGLLATFLGQAVGTGGGCCFSAQSRLRLSSSCSS
ncbi:hypothetical protein AYX19_08240 [Paenarthrobacter ureafaciens]|nr:hypothetical protein AYX19_08240 [Paenarthrobacter ureafaciens]